MMHVDLNLSTLPDTYFALVRKFPLIHIEAEIHLAQAQEVLDELIQVDLDRGGQAYLEALTDLVMIYEAENEPIADAPALDVLRELIASSGLSQQKLAKAVGIAQSSISAILNGTRKLTVDQIVKLAQHFQVSPAVFLPR